MITNIIKQAADAIKEGAIIAYPTEAVYGLGCDPFNLTAVTTLQNLKQRPQKKGLILLTNSWEKVLPYITHVSSPHLTQAKAAKKPITWVYPASDKIPSWLLSHENTIAIRVCNHPIAKALCAQISTPIISTSANYSGLQPAKTVEQVKQQFADLIQVIVPGEVGPLKSPTEIRDIISGEIIRSNDDSFLARNK